MKPLHRFTFLGALLSATLFFCLYTIPFIRHFQRVSQPRQPKTGFDGSLNGEQENYGSVVAPKLETTRYLARKNLTANTVRHTGRNAESQHPNRNPSVIKHLASIHVSWILKPRILCDNATMLVILVCSGVHRFELRDAIRTTWGTAAQKQHSAVRLVFVLGKPEARYEHLRAAITNESLVFGDVLQNDIVDSYANLSLKTQAALAWTLSTCGVGTYFVAKTDDDVYINIPGLVLELARMNLGGARRFMMGRLIRDAKPNNVRTSKWYTPHALYPNRTYPPYLSGSAYVMSADLLTGLLRAATHRKLFWLEDVYITGLLSMDVGAQLVHNERFSYTKVSLSDPCRYESLLASHELTPTDLRTLWAVLHRPDSTCGGSSNEHFRASHAFR